MLCFLYGLFLEKAFGAMLPTDKKMTDGCRYVFLDVGANIGMHARFLFESDKYVGNGYSTNVFDKIFPLKRNNRSDLCYIGVEPYPIHKPRLEALKKFYASKGYSMQYISGAASNRESTIIMRHANTTEDTLNNEWGFQARPREATGNKKPPTELDISVKSFDLSAFIRDHVIGRKIPEIFTSSSSSSSSSSTSLPPPAVAMKLDVEGAEYDILPSLLESGIWCDIDHITIEFHKPRQPEPEPEPEPEGHLRSNVTKHKIESLVKHTVMLFKENVSKCKDTTFKIYDCEKYNSDTTEGLSVLC